MSSIMLQRKISFIIDLLLYLILDSQRNPRKLIKDFTNNQKSAFNVPCKPLKLKWKKEWNSNLFQNQWQYTFSSYLSFEMSLNLAAS